MLEHVISDKLPSPAGPYSHVVTAGNMVWTAGFGPTSPDGGPKPEGITAQTHAAIDNVERALQTVGLELRDVVKATIHLQNVREDFAAFNQAYAQRFPSPQPVRTTVGSELLNILVEIDVVAVRPS